MIPNTMAW